MRITLDDSAGPGQWAIDVKPTRRSETAPSPAKVILILNMIQQSLLQEMVLAEVQEEPVEEKPSIMLPGVHFPAGSLPKLPPTH